MNSIEFAIQAIRSETRREFGRMLLAELDMVMLNGDEEGVFEKGFLACKKRVQEFVEHDEEAA